MDMKFNAIIFSLLLSLGLNVYALYRISEVEGSLPAPSEYDGDTLKEGLDYLQSHINEMKEELRLLDTDLDRLKIENSATTRKFQEICTLSSYQICVN